MWATISAGQVWSGEVVNKRKDGTLYTEEMTITPVRDEHAVITNFIAIKHDITARKQAEEAVRTSQRLIEDIINAMPVRVFWKDQDLIYLGCNMAFARDQGFAYPQDIIGKDDFQLSTKAQAELYRRDDREVIANGTAKLFIEEPGPTGKKRTLLTSKLPLRDAQGQINGVLGMYMDITERKQMEEQLRESNRQLDQAVTDLQKTQQQVAQQTSLRALGQMASGMAHDFNNTLSPIVGFSELLLKHKEKLANQEEVIRFLQIINTAGHDAADVVRRLREFGRQREMGELSEAIDLVGLIRQTIELTEPRWKDQAQAAGLTIQLKTEFGKVPLIAGEEFAIRELLTNLIFNAVDAMPDGGTITLGTAGEEGWVRLWVGDTGTGMTEEVRQRCFEPFFTTKAENGSGLGLAMVHGIVQRHGGTVEIISDLGKGTTFNIRLPVQLPKVMSVAPVVESSPNRKLHVLVVDDEPMLRDLVEVWLKEDGHTVATAANGMEALTRLRVDRFDVVITDKAMPKMNGEQLAVAIHSTTPELPVILMTGFGEMMKEAGPLPPPISALLSKPITQDSLRAVLAQALPA